MRVARNNYVKVLCKLYYLKDSPIINIIGLFGVLISYMCIMSLKVPGI